MKATTATIPRQSGDRRTGWSKYIHRLCTTTLILLPLSARSSVNLSLAECGAETVHDLQEQVLSHPSPPALPPSLSPPSREKPADRL